MADKSISFGQKAADRIKNAVIRVERNPYDYGGGAQRATLWNPGTIEGILTSNLPACNGNTYGSGTFQPFFPVFNSNTNTFVAAPDTSFGNTNAAVILNWSQNSNTINSGTHVGAAWRNGSLVLAWADC
jgi:hypothetical protein